MRKCLTTASAELVCSKSANTRRIAACTGFVGIQHHLAGRIIHQATGQAKPQLSVFSFRQLPTLQSLLQPVQFSLAHGAFEAKQQSIVVAPGIVDGFFVNDQCLGERTDFQQVIPIAAGASQARDFQAQRSHRQCFSPTSATSD